MRSYEILLILPADADDKVVESVTDRITGVVSGPAGRSPRSTSGVSAGSPTSWTS